MRKIIIIVALQLGIVACSKQTPLNNDDGAQGATKADSASTISSGSGTPGSSAIDDDPAGAQTQSPLPPPTGFVNDYAEVIDVRAKKELESMLASLKGRSKIEFDVVTVGTTGGQTSFDYTMAVARGWGVGAGDQSEGGIILLVAIEDRKWECRWTRNLEGQLRGDLIDGLERQMTPRFRQGKYSEGIKSAVEMIVSRLSEKRGPAIQK
ncbi:MAG TPA: TPM domain-containing protein [Pyrinomonadaceae bacterium]